MSVTVSFSLNGRPVTAEVEPRTTLADCLRHKLKATGTHVGCEHGVCGACTVIIDGAAVRSCLTLAVQAETMMTYWAIGPTAPSPACRPTPRLSAKTPSGAAHKTQRTIVIMASAMALSTSTSRALRSADSRVAATPKNMPNTTSGSMALSAAAWIGLVGASAFSHSPKPGVGTAARSTAPAPALRAAAPAASTGHSASAPWITSVP